jgi:hypothetical protein
MSYRTSLLSKTYTTSLEKQLKEPGREIFNLF